MSNKQVSRRRFLKLGATGAIVIVVAGVGAYFALRPPVAPSQPTPTPTPAAPPVQSALIEKANEEGQVSLYNVFTVEAMKMLKARFEQKYPKIKLESVNPGAGVAIEKYLTEYRAGKHIMDVFWGTATYVLPALKEGIVASYISPEDAFYPREQKEPGGLWTSPVLAPQTIAWNTEKVKPEEAPKSWWDILQPRFKGKIGIYDPRFVPASILIMKKSIIGPDRWIEWLKKFAAQEPKNLGSTGPLTTALKTGEIEIAAWSWASSLLDLIKQGTPIEVSRRKGVLVGHVEPFWIYKFAPHPNAARLLKDYVCSVEGQSAFNDFGGYVPTRNGIASKWGKGIGTGEGATASDVTDVFPYTEEELNAVVSDWNTYVGR